MSSNTQQFLIFGVALPVGWITDYEKEKGLPPDGFYEANMSLFDANRPGEDGLTLLDLTEQNKGFILGKVIQKSAGDYKGEPCLPGTHDLIKICPDVMTQIRLQLALKEKFMVSFPIKDFSLFLATVSN